MALTAYEEAVIKQSITTEIIYNGEKLNVTQLNELARGIRDTISDPETLNNDYFTFQGIFNDPKKIINTTDNTRDINRPIGLARPTVGEVRKCLIASVDEIISEQVATQEGFSIEEIAWNKAELLEIVDNMPDSANEITLAQRRESLDIHQQMRMIMSILSRQAQNNQDNASVRTGERSRTPLRRSPGQQIQDGLVQLESLLEMQQNHQLQDPVIFLMDLMALRILTIMRTSERTLNLGQREGIQQGFGNPLNAGRRSERPLRRSARSQSRLMEDTPANNTRSKRKRQREGSPAYNTRSKKRSRGL